MGLGWNAVSVVAVLPETRMKPRRQVASEFAARSEESVTPGGFLRLPAGFWLPFD